ncbi:MAG: spondin domain-containing protein [Chloroflexota bacterium]
MIKRFSLVAVLLLALGIVAQAQDDDMGETTTFIVTIENISGLGLYDNAGVSAIPIGGTEAGPALPDSGYVVEFNAEAGQYLSFVTMLAQSNDLFFAPDEIGIPLFDEEGNPVSGDVTDQVLLWDAGTEVNQALGEGDQQAPRQAGPNTGDDENGVVLPVSALDDGFDYPATSDYITVNLEAGENGAFTLTITNISGDLAIAGPVTPVVWVVHGGDDMMMEDDMDEMADDMMATHGVFFTTGEPDYGQGLEAVAEDGNPATLGAVVAGGGFETPITPIVYAVHDNMMDGGIFFTTGEADRGNGLEAVAEDGSPAALGEYATSNYASSGVSPIPLGAEEAGPALPGSGYTFTIEATAGEALTFVTMFVQSNDLFFAPSEAGIPLFDDMGSPITGDVTRYVELWDAGTEVNEAPGEGTNQAPRQAGADTGDDEMGTVVLVSDSGDGFDYPAVASVIQVTIEVDDMMMGDE